MSTEARPRRVRADAERSTARILEAAEAVLAVDPQASLERIADAAGLARATVHRRFTSRKALLEALAEQLNERFLLALNQARVATAPPVVALHRLAGTVFELKITHRFAMTLSPCEPTLSQEVLDGLDRLFTRLHAAGAITSTDPQWCRRVFLAMLSEVSQLPPDSPELAPAASGPIEAIGARTDLLTRTVLGALGGPTVGPQRSPGVA
jgi:AcrR family transcriptional regulator